MILLILSTSFAQVSLGDAYIPGTGLTLVMRSPTLNDLCYNPASFFKEIYTEFTVKTGYSYHSQFSPSLSSFGLSFPVLKQINIGGSADILFNENFTYAFPPDSNEWDTFVQTIRRRGNIIRYAGSLSGKWKNLTFGLRYGYIYGESQYIWDIDFSQYRDLCDTTTTYNQGLTYSGGFKLNLNRLVIAGFAEKVYISGNNGFTKINVYEGLNYQNGNFRLFLSFKNLYPQAGIIWNGFGISGGYIRYDGTKIYENNTAISYTGNIKGNNFTVFLMARFLKDLGTGYSIDDSEIVGGISFEFKE